MTDNYFHDYWPTGANFNAGETLKFKVTLLGSGPENLVTRDWVGIKAHMNTAFYDYLYDTYDYFCCTVGTAGWDYYAYFCLEQWFRGYGEGFYERSSLFSSVSLSALSNLVNY